MREETKTSQPKCERKKCGGAQCGAASHSRAQSVSPARAISSKTRCRVIHMKTGQQLSETYLASSRNHGRFAASCGKVLTWISRRLYPTPHPFRRLRQHPASISCPSAAEHNSQFRWLLVRFGGLWWPLVDSSLLGNPVNHANFVKRLKESKVLVKASALGFLCCLYSLLLNLRSAPICVDRFSPRFRFRAKSCNSCLDHVWSSLVRQSDRPTIPIFIPVLDRFSGPEFFSGHFR
jgi:hypothetical protein